VSLVALAVLVLSSSVVAQEVPTIYLYVNDFVGVLTYDEISTLDQICYELDSYNTDEVAIVIVNDTHPLGIDMYALELFETNGIGKEDKDNGVLLFISVGESLWRIEVGYGLEGVLNDAKVGSIGRESLEPYLATGEYYAGIFYTVAALVEALTEEPSRDSGGIPLFGYHVDTWKLTVAIVVLVAVAVITRGRIFLWLGNILTRGRFGGGRSGGGGARGRF